MAPGGGESIAEKVRVAFPRSRQKPERPDRGLRVGGHNPRFAFGKQKEQVHGNEEGVGLGRGGAGRAINFILSGRWA